MFLSKTRKFTTTLAAAALAMSTLIATPVQAKNEDLAKLFVGATALFIIGNAINENNRKTQQARRDPPRPQPDWRDDRRHDRDRGRDDHRPGRAYDSRPTYPRYQPRPVMAVPSHCLVMTYVDGYRAKGYSAACARDYASIPTRLPQSCLQETSSRQGPRYIYRQVCMQQNGWQAS
ncbi:hypothetical protein DL237_02265 [Pseudooceanicola sediminis]|uniref:Lectin-like protein BA14k n=1 Tax=Pseudooceanicola sediminis TaxID=2211117 RepID=A0A399J4I1_9RHOB|nr:hypothetical protein [Pseudooceanicola sediminis]KAA2315630.1 hypothetical protein E0K93_07230 [Puniceibacterium sp. HSS470]RII40171.1 hypothetical protein DL237_02265 [Pseudooceanicola sediminis]|tara:strand:- start:105454 stop:105981 length:528 start_codon:yes stop_codon:yes gene_type:complete